MSFVQPIVVVSTGRTGTIFLAELLSQLFPQAEVHHERGFSQPINILTNIYLDGLIPKSVLKLTWKFLKGSELKSCQNSYSIDVNNYLYGIVSHTPELYPGLKVVHIIRDPRTYVRSHLNWSWQTPRSFVANYLLPFWQPNPFLTRSMPFKQAISLTRFQRFCWIWVFKNRQILSLESGKVRYHVVRFEDLFNNPESKIHLNQMLSFIGLPEIDQLPEMFLHPRNETKLRTFPAWEDWTPIQCAQLDQLCSDLMSRFGYGNESLWQEKVTVGYPMLSNGN